VRAKVRDGRLIVDQPTDLPDGTVLELVIDDEGDELDEEERRALNAAISRSIETAASEGTKSAEEVLDALRARRRG
jgi:hypothetical protein